MFTCNQIFLASFHWKLLASFVIFLSYWKFNIRLLGNSNLRRTKISLRSFRFIHKDILDYARRLENERFASGYCGPVRLAPLFIIWPNLPKSWRWRDARHAGKRCRSRLSFSVNVMPLASIFAPSHRRGSDEINAEEVSNPFSEFGNNSLLVAFLMRHASLT